MAISPKRILWPTDFSELSRAGGRYARAFKDSFGCELHVVHVIAPPLSPDVSLMLPAEVPIMVSEPQLLGAAKQGLDRLILELFGGDPAVRRDAFFGNAWVGTCDYATKHQIDLIIVGTHGRTGLTHALIGSTAERIVRHAPCPVLVVKSGGRDFVA